MPLRTITLNDGTVCTRMIINLHPDGTEFLPEEFAIPSDTSRGEQIYKALERLIDSVWGRGKVKSESK